MNEENLGWFKRFVNWLFRNWDWWQKWFGPGTADDWRNPFWRWGEVVDAVEVYKAKALIDIRIGYWAKDTGKWVWWHKKGPYEWVRGVHGNFYNAVLSYHRSWISGYHARTNQHGEWTRWNFVFRPCHKYYFLAAWGRVPDQGFMGRNFQICNFDSESKHNPGVITADHLEGKV